MAGAKRFIPMMFMSNTRILEGAQGTGMRSLRHIPRIWLWYRPILQFTICLGKLMNGWSFFRMKAVLYLQGKGRLNQKGYWRPPGILSRPQNRSFFLDLYETPP